MAGRSFLPLPGPIRRRDSPGQAGDSPGGTLTFPQFDPIIAFGYMGDYIANVSDWATEYFAWGDNRDTVTGFLYPSGRADPDVFFARQ